jgi:hypothetical protein
MHQTRFLLVALVSAIGQVSIANAGYYCQCALTSNRWEGMSWNDRCCMENHEMFGNEYRYLEDDEHRGCYMGTPEDYAGYQACCGRLGGGGAMWCIDS